MIILFFCVTSSGGGCGWQIATFNSREAGSGLADYSCWPYLPRRPGEAWRGVAGREKGEWRREKRGKGGRVDRAMSSVEAVGAVHVAVTDHRVGTCTLHKRRYKIQRKIQRCRYKDTKIHVQRWMWLRGCASKSKQSHCRNRSHSRARTRGPGPKGQKTER